MSFPRTVAVVGLGLMGGSLARDLAGRGIRVVAYDSRAEIAQSARRDGIVADLLDSSLAGAGDADLIVLAVPVDTALDILAVLARLGRSESLITDLGSTKSAIVNRAEELGLGGRFVGAHPLAGDHRSGWTAARPGLYRGATVFLSPAPSATVDARTSIRQFWEAVGGVCREVDAAEHDRTMAWVSHLPQIASSALAATLADAGFAGDQLGAGGRDVTRLAASSPEMWKAISLANASALLPSVTALRQRIEGIEDALRRADGDALERFFHDARRLSDPASGI